jgi:hypothetical protein
MNHLVIAAIALVPVIATAQETSEVVLVSSVFAELQPISFAKNVEYCGYFGFNADGQLIASKPTRGDEDSCLSDDPHFIEVITASYHTHGGHSLDYFNEVPSGEDMEGDADEGIDGYVATPGGRLWYIDSVDMIASQLCGIGCLPADHTFVVGDNGPVAESYSYDDLIIRLEE